jgi:hypothetical protein
MNLWPPGKEQEWRMGTGIGRAVDRGQAPVSGGLLVGGWAPATGERWLEEW